MDKEHFCIQQSSVKNSCKIVCNDDKTAAKNDQNINHTENGKVIFKTALNSDVRVINLKEKSCLVGKENSYVVGKEHMSNNYHAMDAEDRLDRSNPVSVQRKDAIACSNNITGNQKSMQIQHVVQMQYQLDSKVSKPLQNKVNHQQLDDIDDGNTVMNLRKNLQTSSSSSKPHADGMIESDEVTNSVAAEMETININKRTSPCIDDVVSDLVIQAGYMQTLDWPQVIPPHSNTDNLEDQEDTESEGDSAYSYESDYFPFDAVELNPEKPVWVEFHTELDCVNDVSVIGASSQNMPLLENEVAINLLQCGSQEMNDDSCSKLDDGCLVSSWVDDDYRLEKNPSRGSHESSTNFGCQMRMGDSTSSLAASHKSQEMKWSVQHVHLGFFNEFGDCFDEEEDYS